MNLDALKQKLASLDINPDEIEDERYALIIRTLFSIIEEQNKEIETLKAENQRLRDEINLLKMNKTNLKFVVLKRMMIPLLTLIPHFKTHKCHMIPIHAFNLSTSNAR